MCIIAVDGGRVSPAALSTTVTSMTASVTTNIASGTGATAGVAGAGASGGARPRDLEALIWPLAHEHYRRSAAHPCQRFVGGAASPCPGSAGNGWGGPGTFPPLAWRA